MKENHVNLIHYKCIIRNELIESRSKNIVRVSIFRNLLKRSISWIPLEIKQKKLNQGKSAFVTTAAPRTINYSLVTPVDCPSEPHYNETSRIRRKTKYLVDAILFNDLGSHVVYVNRRHVVCVYVYIYIYIYIYKCWCLLYLPHRHTHTQKLAKSMHWEELSRSGWSLNHFWCEWYHPWRAQSANWMKLLLGVALHPLTKKSHLCFAIMMFLLFCFSWQLYATKQPLFTAKVTVWNQKPNEQ